MSAQPAPNRDSEARAAPSGLGGRGAPLTSADLIEELLERAAQRGAELALAKLPEPTTDQVWFDVKQAAAYCGKSEEVIRSASRPAGPLRRRTRGQGSVSF